ncbi:acriflavin resistance protein [Chthoniobacter flavus Ellin428]|uniref:Acriflavin resistance protein n=1 Tax=Chthoniobacter flavus Ellin428 TaxID=497964 RepID=B4DA07_9BACT|nr:efflux RND transporter permease subunit [Chthoniobacter flavus]EDY16761.1 acriflavin resistance protein [Chthoniobacter flavus Ellin428]TCO86716.1 multidrug efflux pump subunit AcrB [Chthoniobacter flavus]
MWIVRLALRRPYTFIVASLLLLLLTPFVLLRTPTDIFPAINIPVISVIWQYAGLSAQEMEQRILFNHERSLSATVTDIEHVESNSYNGVGIIKVFLQPGANVDGGVAQITAVAQTILKQMPPGQTPPLVIRYNASTVPILQYSLSSKKLSEQEVADLALNQVRVGIANIPGAQIPWPYGGRQRTVVVDLNLDALKSKNLKAQDIVDAVNAQNLILPSGTSKIGQTEYDISVNSSPRVLEELNNLPIKRVNGTTIYVKDVAQVRDGFNPQTNIVRMNGQRGALITIMKSGFASTLDVVRKVKAQLPKVLTTVTPDLDVQEFADQSLFVRAAISGVLKEGTIAAALTAIMILLFIGSWRSTVIIALSIPLSILVSLAVLSALGETINLMTLGGLSLAVGILVDDATVEIENVHRQMAMGKPLVTAILDGAEEIALPAFVSTLCICIVFVPMFFLTGVARFLFVPLAEAVVFAMLASYFLSRTLIPTLVMYFYRNSPYTGHGEGEDHADEAPPRGWSAPFVIIQRAFERGFSAFRGGYRNLLTTILRKRWTFATIFLLFCLATFLLGGQLGQDFFPKVDGGQIRLHLRGRSGTRIEESAQFVGRVEKTIQEVIPKSELDGILDNIGIPFSGIALSYSNSGVIGTSDADILISLTHDHRPTEGYIHELRSRLNHEYPNTIFYFLPADIVSQTLNLGLPAPFDVQIYGRDLVTNRAIAAQLADKIRRVNGAVDVRVQQPADLPRLTVNVDRDKAGELGLQERDVANSVLLSLSGSGQVQPVYWLNPKLGIQYTINIRAPEHVMDSIPALEDIPVSSSRGGDGDGQILTNVASIQRSQTTPVFSHYNVLPVIDVFGGVSGRDLGGVLRDVQPILDEAKKTLPRGSFIEVRGQAETMHSSYVGLGLGLCGAIVLIYLLLVVNFQSWLDPFIIISALPGALAGVIWGLWVSHTALSVPALMGAIMSLGVATANSVLVVTFARTNFHDGMDATAAALLAGATRLRAVVMTALAMIIGMLPMSLGLGEGGEQNAPVGRAVIGGLLLATLATLFFVPVVFSLCHPRRHVNTAPTILDETSREEELATA